MNNGGTNICARGTRSLCHECERSATLPDLIDNQDRASLERFVGRHARNGRRWATTSRIVVFSDGDQEIANAEPIGEHRTGYQTTSANREDGIGALRFGECLNLQGERLNMPVHLLPRQDERFGVHLSGRGRVPG